MVGSHVVRTVRSLHRLTVSISVVRLVLSLSPLSRRVADVRTTMLYGLRKSRGVMYTLINTLDREPRLVLLRTTATSDSRSRRCALWLVCRDSRVGACWCVRPSERRSDRGRGLSAVPCAPRRPHTHNNERNTTSRPKLVVGKRVRTEPRTHTTSQGQEGAKVSSL